MSNGDRGICITCNSHLNCSLRATKSAPVYYCEEFDDYVPVPAPRVQQSSTTMEEHSKGHNGAVGLCLDCENRDKCAFSKSEEGIWHCEEYR